MKYIQSSKNEKVKQWKKLTTKKERDKSGLFLVEGEHLVEEALQAGLIQEVIVTESYQPKLAKVKFSGHDVFVIANDISKLISETETPQGIFAVCKQFNHSKVAGSKYLLIDAVQDPGNLGTMIRTADAVGADAVIVGEGSVDVYNAKVLRSAQGSNFHLPIIRGNLHEWIDKLQQQSIPVYGTALQNGEPMYEVQSGASFAIIVGNEGQGVDPSLLAKTTKNLYIPIYGKSESLNVAVATGVLLYYLRGNK
ncbi:RNA methyltransferase [Caldibacillus lycopersici]|uniref:RNA methyltransferase n=1 Tax=Perspicuibacillus lycopersici TaxID=1325689 RepID=A0AAE3ITL3_9BACI|nr:RNA methyltransferase [Perspicuibacillus lycopersici]MCU9614152.1 RNA methyltransferase [Perspicuibacillus lycopersici]